MKICIRNQLCHLLNPLHLIYSPLRRLGLGKEIALKISKEYEGIYRLVFKEVYVVNSP